METEAIITKNTGISETLSGLYDQAYNLGFLNCIRLLEARTYQTITPEFIKTLKAVVDAGIPLKPSEDIDKSVPAPSEDIPNYQKPLV